MVKLSIDSEATSHADRSLDFDYLEQWFFPANKNRLIGLEVECGLVWPESGMLVGYGEPSGGRALLRELLETLGGEPIIEGSAIIGIILDDKSTLTMEMSGAVEYSSRPGNTLTEVLVATKFRLVEVARVAERMGVRLLSGGYLPFDTTRSIGWVPKPRTEIMRRHFRELGEAGRFGDEVMGLTLSTQVNLDALSPDEYIEKIRTLAAISPLISALLVNTPSLTGAAEARSSTRMGYWRHIDPMRCQDLTSKMIAAESMRELISAFVAVPMIYRQVGCSVVRAPDYSFHHVLRRGFQDGSSPTILDWEAHLSQLWPAVRARRTLETRLPDGPSWEHLDSLPALFVGLVEEPAIRSQVAALVGELSADQLDSLTVVAARSGFRGFPVPIQEMVQELLRLASEGLASRVAQGLEEPALLQSIEPVHEIVASGRTFADRLLEMWNSSWKQNARRYVETMAVPTE